MSFVCLFRAFLGLFWDTWVIKTLTPFLVSITEQGISELNDCGGEGHPGDHACSQRLDEGIPWQHGWLSRYLLYTPLKATTYILLQAER